MARIKSDERITTKVTVRLCHNSSIPGARWCEPIGWEPANAIEGAEWVDGGWWGDDEQEAGLVCFGHPATYREDTGEDETAEVTLADLRVASCGNCRVIAEVRI